MAPHTIIAGALLGIGVCLCVFCSIGLALMHDPFQRMQFNSPISSLAIVCIAAAVWIEDSQWQARIKASLVALVLFFMNAILSHATARAIRIRKVEHWPLLPEEKIPVVRNRVDEKTLTNTHTGTDES